MSDGKNSVTVRMELPCLYPCIVTVERDEDGEFDVVDIAADLNTGNVCHAVPIDDGMADEDHKYAIEQAKEKLGEAADA